MTTPAGTAAPDPAGSDREPPMNDLRRQLAPIPDEAWRMVDEEARRTLEHMLTARRLVDFRGPEGWQCSAVGLGRTAPLEPGPRDGVVARLRRVLPLVELRTDFELSRGEVDDAARGADDIDLDPVREAARAAAKAEDAAVFHGYGAGGLVGIAEAATHDPIAISDNYLEYPAIVSQAVAALRSEGIAGPYALALGPRCFTGLVSTLTAGGFPVYDDVRRLVDGPVVWAPAVDGAVLLSMRGGDFELVSGRDLSIGYEHHDATSVRLYVVESFAFRVLGAEAAVYLSYGAR